MKKVLVSAVVLGSMAVAGVAMAGMSARTGVNGSLHDMNAVVTNADSMARVCVFCHTPHNAEANSALNPEANAPLWNHKAGTATYLPYVWVTPLNQKDSGGADFGPLSGTEALQGPSRLCMTCHDGSIAVDQHGKAVEQIGTKKMGDINSGRANLTGDLTKTHPIGFNYEDIRTLRNTAATGGLADATTGDTEIVSSDQKFATAVDTAVAQGTYNTVERLGTKKIKDVLFQGNIMTCASCHEVHNKENVIQDNYVAGSGMSGAPNYFLYAKEAQSLICLSCHIK
ncbi:cytochrome C [Geomonas propionica]|uniref:Cytochrome C n=1 Tax=Geomonas propionica TaxID=2798582 RepID=A0ABS0YSU8_9BACT|nr:cytochrome C [Geomonas propionica]MBJ6801018.1 cytochrome C [Geomonas propionica]